VIAGLADASRPADKLSLNQSTALAATGKTVMGYKSSGEIFFIHGKSVFLHYFQEPFGRAIPW
jgi:hypothetical protein